MKKLYILMLLLSVTTVVSAQKMTIKTANGQKVEIVCEGMVPNQVVVVKDSVILKMNPDMAEAKTNPVVSAEEEADSVDTFVPVENEGEEKDDSTAAVAPNQYLTNSNQSALSLIAEGIAEELSPEYAQFVKEHENYHPKDEKEVVKDVAKKFIDKDVVETADFLTTLFGSIRLTKDSLFKAEYSQRKPKKLFRTYNTIELSGSLGKNIENVSADIDDQIDAEDYGKDTENNNKFGGGMKYSRNYIQGYEVDGQWQPNPLGFAWSWGGLVAYSYEKDMGSSFSMMGKVGAQLGNDITIGVDALAGFGITPYDLFFSNGYQYAVINRSVFGFKYGVELWGSLNFSKDTYTTVYGRYIRSVKPSENNGGTGNWELVYADFDPSNWSVGFAVGYKFGAPQPLSQDKRLQISLNTGYSLTEKESFIEAEFEKITQVSKSTYLNYGLLLERTLRNENSSIMFSTGFKVRQPDNSWFWGIKLLAGIGQYHVDIIDEKSDVTMGNLSQRLCGRGALQFNTGFKIGKLSEIYGAFRAGYHAGKSVDTEKYSKNILYKNLKGFDAGILLGYKLTF